MFLIIVFVVVSMAQTSTGANNPSDLQVVKISWKRDTRPAREAYPKDEKRLEEKLPDVTEKRTKRSSRPDRKEQTTVYDRASRASQEVEDLWPENVPLVDGYLYQMTVRNTGRKEIKAVHWQYIFTDSLDPNIVTRHQFQSRAKISPGKEIKLSRFAVTPPSQVVNAKAIEIDLKQQYSEQVLITRIEYADGSAWEHSDR
ncbi:MAG TPA: hypothetical protein VF658_00270 [Pyrinomonadaceae bacterium]